MWKKAKSERLGLFVPFGSTQQTNIVTEGRVRIDGTFSGNVFSESHMAIGKEGSFEGEADVLTAEIAGTFNGNLRVQKQLVILKTGRFFGNLDAPVAKIESGSEIVGEVRIKGQ